MTRTDRIAGPWGTRTPYGPGDTWPVRVDTFLADDLQPQDVDRWVQSATILHSNGDGLDIAVKDDRSVGVGLRGRPVDRVNQFGIMTLVSLLGCWSSADWGCVRV
jgi:hypothetical protein